MRHDDRLDKPGSPGFRIKDLHAFIAIDPTDDSEGIVGFTDLRTGINEPLIGADQERIESHRPYVEGVVAATGQPIKLVRFSVREEVETFT
jgi:hypothetical protein